MSKGFLSALAGVAITLLGWYGPWAWPALPGLIVLDTLITPTGLYSDGPYLVRAAILVLLIAVNVGAWGAVVRLVLWALYVSHRARARSL